MASQRPPFRGPEPLAKMLGQRALRNPWRHREPEPRIADPACTPRPENDALPLLIAPKCARPREAKGEAALPVRPSPAPPPAEAPTAALLLCRIP